MSEGVRDAAARRPRSMLATLLVFAALSPILLCALERDLRPEPVYPSQDPSRRTPTLAVLRAGPVEVQLELPRPPDALWIPVWVGDPDQPLRVAVTDVESGRPLGRSTIARSGVHALELTAADAGARRLRVRFESDSLESEFAPRLMWARERPRADRVAAVAFAGRPIAEVEWLADTGPLFVVSYPWPSRAGSWAWFVLLLPGAWAWRRPDRAPWLLVFVGLAGILTSVLLWQRDYSRLAQHLDADRFTRSAYEMARFVFEPAERERIAAWYRDYPHAHNSLVPALMALPIALGAKPHLVYLELSALATFLALLLGWRLLSIELGVGERTALATTVLFACHLLVLRSFARPVSDSVGLLLVVALLWLLARRMRCASRLEDGALNGLLLLCALARPQGLAYWLFVSPALVICSRLRTGAKPSPSDLAREQLRIFLLPLLGLAGAFVYFDWFHNVEAMFLKAQRFRVASTASMFAHSLVGLVQWLPLLLLVKGARRRLGEPTAWLAIAWSIFQLALLVAVGAPFWLRHFLPVLPALTILVALAIDGTRGRRRSVAHGLLLATAIANVVATVHQIRTLGPLEPAIAGFISTP